MERCIGQEFWFFDRLSIAMTGMMGPRHELSMTDYLTGKQSAKKHGVGL
jgi:hypothetical protein